MRKIPNKVISVITLAAYLVTWSSHIGYGQEISVLNPPSLSSLSSFSLSIPQEIGKINSTGKDVLSEQHNQKVIVHIRDAHGSYEAQSNIEKILGILNQDYGFNEILLEGAPANARLNPEILNLFRDQDLNLKIADQMMTTGDLTGSELFLLKNINQKSLVAHGAEDLKLYAENLRSYRQVALRRTKSEAFVKKLNAQIEMVASKKFGKNLRDFIKTWSAWRNQQIDFSAYLSAIKKTAQKELDLDLSHAKNQEVYPMLVRFFKAKDFELRINLEQVKSEQARFSKYLVEISTNPKLKKILSQWQPESGFSGWGEQSLPRDLLEELYYELEPKGFRFEDYPELSRAWGSLILQSELESNGLFDEINRLNHLLFDQMARSTEERRLVELIHRAIVLDQLLKLELIREDAVKIKTQPKLFYPSRIYRDIWELGRDSEFDGSKKNFTELDRIFDFAVQFYDQAIAREDAIVQNVKARLEASGERKIVLVTGGFHSSSFERIFKESNFSYLEITPRMTHVDQVAKIYSESMLGTRKTIFDTAHLGNLLSLLAADSRGEVSRAAGRPFQNLDPLTKSVVSAMLEIVRMPDQLLEFNASNFAGKHSLSFRKIEDLKTRAPYIQLVWTDKAGVAHEVISIPVKNGVLVSSPIKASSILTRQTSETDQRQAIQHALGLLGSVKTPDSGAAATEPWFVVVNSWQNEVRSVVNVGASAELSLSKLGLPPARSELRSDALQLISQGPGLWIALSVGVMALGWGISLVKRSVFGKNVSIADRLGGFIAGTVFSISSLIGLPIVLWLAVASSPATTNTVTDLSKEPNVIPQLISPKAEAVQRDSIQDFVSETQAAPVTFDQLIQSAQTANYKKFLERTYEVYRFLEWSETVRGAKLYKPSQYDRRASFLRGYLVIWQAENPNDAAAQKGGGPAIGPEQVELETARDVLLWAQRFPKEHHISILLNTARQFLELDISRSALQEAKFSEFLAENRLLQLLVWQLVIERKGKYPTNGIGWAKWHADYYNTSYLEDLERLNRNQPIGFFDRGLAIEEKTKMIDLLVAKTLHDLAKIFSLPVEEVSEALRQAEARFNVRVKEIDRLSPVYENITRILRVVRNADFDINRGNASYDLKIATKVIRELKALDTSDLKKKLSELSRIITLGFSKAEWNSLIQDANYVIEEIDKRRAAILNKATKRDAQSKKPADAKQLSKKPRSELRSFNWSEIWRYANAPLFQIGPAIHARSMRIAYRNVLQRSFELAVAQGHDPNERIYFEKMHVIRSEGADRYVKLVVGSHWHWIGLEGFFPKSEEQIKTARQVADKLHDALRLGGYAVFAHPDQTIVEKVAKEAREIGFRVLPHGQAKDEPLTFSESVFWTGRIHFVLLNKVKLRRVEESFRAGYGSNVVEVVHLTDGRVAIKKSIPPIRLIQEQLLTQASSLRAGANIAESDTVTLDDLLLSAEEKQKRLLLLLKREKSILPILRQKLKDSGDLETLKHLPEFYDVSEGDHEIYMNFLRDGVRPIELSRFITEASTILDAIHRVGYIHGDTSHFNWIIGAHGVELFDFGTVRAKAENIFGEVSEDVVLSDRDLTRLREIFRKTGPISRGLRLEDPRLRHVREKIGDPQYLTSPWIDYLGFAVMLMQLPANTQLTSLLNVSGNDLEALRNAASEALLRLDSFSSVSEIANFVIAKMNTSPEIASKSELRVSKQDVGLDQLPRLLEGVELDKLLKWGSDGARAFSLVQTLLKSPDDPKVPLEFATINELYEAVGFYQVFADAIRKQNDSPVWLGNELEVDMEFNTAPSSVKNQLTEKQIILAAKWQRHFRLAFPKNSPNSDLWNQSQNRTEINKINSILTTILKNALEKASASNAQSELRVRDVDSAATAVSTDDVTTPPLAAIEPAARSELRLIVSRLAEFVAPVGNFDLVANVFAAEPASTTPIQSVDTILARVFNRLSEILRNQFRSVKVNPSLKSHPPRVVIDAQSNVVKQILKILPQIAALADEFGGAPKLEIHIANVTPEFMKKFIEIRDHNLDASSKSVLEKILRFSSSSISATMNDPKARGAGVFAENEGIIPLLDERTYVTVADISQFETDEQIVGLLIPFLMITAVLGREVYESKSVSEIERFLNSPVIQEFLSEYGIQVTPQNGRFVGTVSQAVLERLITQMRALEEIAQAA